MYQKFKNILAGLVLAWSFLIFTNDSLQAQGVHHFHYNSRPNHPFHVQAPLPQWTPPSVSSSFHYNRNYDYPISAPNNRRATNIPVSTRPPTDLERALIFFDANYLSAFASRLEQGSGALPEEMVTNRDSLIAQGVQLSNQIHAKMVTASGFFKHIDRTAYAGQIKSLASAITILQSEREALFNEAHVVPFHAKRALFNQKLPVINILISELDQKLRNSDYTLGNIEDLNASFAELQSIADIIKAKGEIRQLDPNTDPDLKATQDVLSALRSKIDELESSFKSYHAVYAQKNSAFNKLLEGLNGKIQDGKYSEGHYQDLNDKHDELSALFQKIKIMGSFFGFNPRTHSDYIASEKTLNEAQAYIEKAHQSYENSQYGEILEFEVKTPYIAQGLDNFNAIFLGNQVPEMEAFNKLMLAFMGKGGLPESGKSSSAAVDRSMQGDYLLSSFKYEDSKTDVYMEIGRIIKMDDCQIPLQIENINWDKLSDYSLSLNSINIAEQNREITFAFQREGEKLLLQSNLSSMKNYVAQKKIEEHIFIDPTLVNIPSIDLDAIPTYGLRDRASAFGLECVSVLLDFLPIISSSKSITELIYGKDALTGQQVPRIVSIFAIAYSVIPGGKNLGKAVNLFGENALKFAGRIEKTFLKELFIENGFNNVAQAKNLERFISKAPKNSIDLTIRELPNGGKVFQAKSPGIVPGSYAIYEKQIDKLGNTIQYTKTTYDPKGKLIHVKNKLN